VVRGKRDWQREARETGERPERDDREPERQTTREAREIYTRDRETRERHDLKR